MVAHNISVYRVLGMRAGELRNKVFERAHGYCEWPTCTEPAEELAHLHSKGMGGNRNANRLDNAIAACWLHARFTDGHHPASHDATVRMFGDIGYEWEWSGSLAWHRAEALKRWIGET